jgi:hypothetical protein
MDRTFNSTGSNVFFEFGEQKEYVFPNGKKGVQKEWSIWLSWTSWRITHYNRYITGSNENPEISIQSFLNELLGSRFQSLIFISQFLDIELNFDNGYQINTFFNYSAENQWLVFFPDDFEIVVDCSTKESIKFLQSLSKQINIKDRFIQKDLLIIEEKVNEISYSEGEILEMIMSNGFHIDLGGSAWRLVKGDEYCLGRLDYYFGCKEGREKELRNTVSYLIGKHLKGVSVDSSGMDMRLAFEGGYVFEIFTHARTDPWRVSHGEDTMARANIET